MIARNGRCRRRPAPTRSRASFYGDQIRAEIDAAGPDRLVLDRTFQTQSIDQVFMEPEAGLAWYDSGARKLELVIGVQSPQQAAASVADARVEECRRPGGRQDRRPLRLCRRRLRRQGPHHLSSSTSPWPACSRPTARCASPTIASTSSSSASSATPSRTRSRMAVDRDERPDRCIRRRPGSRRRRPRQSLGRGRLRRRHRLGRHLRRAQGRRDDGGAALARRHRRLDARLRRVADHDRARGDDRRGGGDASARIRSPSARPTCSRPAARPWSAMSSRARCAAARCSTAWRRNRSGPDARAEKAPPACRGIRTRPYGVGLACVSTVFGSGSDPAFALVEIDPPAASPSPRRRSRSAPGSRPRSRCAWPTSSESPPTTVNARRTRRLGRARAGHAGRSIHHHPRAAGRGGEEPALGSRRRAGHHRVDLGPRPHRGRRRGGERDPPLRPLAGRARRSGRPGRSAARPPANSSASRTFVSSTAA